MEFTNEEKELITQLLAQVKVDALSPGAEQVVALCKSIKTKLDVMPSPPDQAPPPDAVK